MQLVIDTNVVLDLWVYQDPHAQPLWQALQTQQVTWLTTAAMREELLRVLDYPHILKRREFSNQSVQDVMAIFDTYAHIKDDAHRAPYICKDADDQKFIDLSVAHTAQLISKDKQVLRLTNRLARLGVSVKKIGKPPQYQACQVFKNCAVCSGNSSGM
ncbi:MAG: putative toxin-antitoxin system toxin component, PIN family [Limnohabitans sp.]|nr:putative toxin-antitoxin system toxin component, PIN family [Limnohabitans sp.]